jgi:hypothetical protein
MKTTNKVVAGVSTVILLGAGLWTLVPKAPPSDEIQIATAIEDAEAAGARGSVSGVMELISADFKAGNLNRPRLQLLLARSKNSARGVNYDVKATTPKILPPNPEKPGVRIVFSTLSVFDSFGGETYWGGGNPVTLVMQKESRRKNLFFSEPVWRVVGIANLPSLPGSDTVL